MVCSESFDRMYIEREKYAELEQKLEEAERLIEHLTMLVNSVAPGFVQKAIAEYKEKNQPPMEI